VRLCTIAPQAIRDLDEISTYFSDRNVESGDRLLRVFDEKCRKLMQFPMIGRSYGDLRPELRGVPLEGYIIFYRVTEAELTVLRVVSGRQNLADLFGDGESGVDPLQIP
jgi:toxin ParE1/3/4